MCTIESCREDSEYLSDYYAGRQLSDSSYTEQFKLIWNFLDHNYNLWDYESSYGINWDQIYEEYLPKVEELDRRSDRVLNSELEQLYTDLLGPLHDGHLQLKIWTNTLPIFISPQSIRIENSRIDYDVPRLFIRDLRRYADEVRLIDGDNDVYWCHFVDNILYYHIQDYALESLKDQERWLNFYNIALELKSNAELKGVVIDLRDFRGGLDRNFHYLLGCLHPINPIGSFHRSGWVRVKLGLGRYDYSPKIMKLWPMDNEYQMNITDVPIVVLSNSRTGSLGEQVCYAAKQLDNGCVIGMRTWGGLSPLNNGGSILGDERGHNCNVYMNIPNSAWFTDDGEILDSKGVTPDIEVQLDVDEYNSTGRDTQLERALEYIRTGK